MGVPEDIAGLKTQIDSLTKRVVALEARPIATPPAPTPVPTPTPTPEQTAENVLNAVSALSDRQKKALWRSLRDGTNNRPVNVGTM